MIYCIGHNIISPLGWTSEENFEAVRQDKTALSCHENSLGVPEAFYAACMDDALIDARFRQVSDTEEDYTKFEKMLILSVTDAKRQAGIALNSDKLVFILSTTKGNVSYLSEEEDERIYLWHSAQKLGRFFENPNDVLVVSNACISGAAAQLEALRLLEKGAYQHAVVVGADVLSKFIVSGFQSFKALSPEMCRPFDKERRGLNLGEAAACAIYSIHADTSDAPSIALVSAALRNDARHISAPSIEAEGLYNALKAATKTIDTAEIAFVNAHGTATLYNDEMEALALNRMSMQMLPVNSLKAHFGHTLGAAGVLESIISMMALSEGTVLKSKACQQVDCKHEIHPVKDSFRSDKKYFIKMVSGFGGGNAVLLFQKVDAHQKRHKTENTPKSAAEKLSIAAYGKLLGDTNENKPFEWTVNGKKSLFEQKSGNILDDIYHSLSLAYPKFFKMDQLCKSGFLVSELLMRAMGCDTATAKKKVSIVLFNRSASSDDDLLYLQSIRDKDDYYPSPSIFVYTLANIVSGEIAIRNKIFGESDFYISEHLSAEALCRQVGMVMEEEDCEAVLCGWIEYFKGKCEVVLYWVNREDDNKYISFNPVTINKLWNS